MPMQPSGNRVKSDINVTPLVDVVLVLLIIFLVITPLLQRGEPVRLPRARTVSELNRGDPILLSVTADGRTFVNRREIARDELAPALQKELAAMPGAPVVLRGDRSLEYRTIREVVREIARTRISEISLAASPVAGEAE